MKTILFLIVSIFFLTTFAGPIAGVPNDLRRQFKSSHKFKEVEVSLNDQKFFARLDTSESKPIMYYQVPKSSKNAVLSQLIKKNLVSGVSIKQTKPANDEGYEEYSAFIENKKIDGAWVRIYTVDDDHIAFGLKLPSSAETTKFKAEDGDGYFLHNDQIVADKKVEKNNGRQFIVFPESSGLKEREVQALTAQEDMDGRFERIQLPRGTFPDQIVPDKFGNIWFTQPSNNLLTSFNPENKKWTYLPVGQAPDGLFLDSKGRLWFGEYNGYHMGMYDPAKKEYKQYLMPYDDPSPAIPYEDKEGLIWITDHASNKVSVLNLETEAWETYTPPNSNSWVVQLVQMSLPVTDDIFATHCYANSIGRIDYVTRTYTSIPLGVSSCPAFFTPVDQYLYISLWSEGSIMKLNVVNGDITEMEIKNKTWNEAGIGPMSSDKKGNVYFASLSNGRVYRLDSKTKNLTYISGVGSTKDGLAVGNDGSVWVTETTGALVRVRFSEEISSPIQ